jgi:hypothetical protein
MVAGICKSTAVTDFRPRRTAIELVALTRPRLIGRYSSALIKIERAGKSWIAVTDCESTFTRDQIEHAANQVRDLFALAD